MSLFTPTPDGEWPNFTFSTWGKASMRKISPGVLHQPGRWCYLIPACTRLQVELAEGWVKLDGPLTSPIRLHGREASLLFLSLSKWHDLQEYQIDVCTWVTNKTNFGAKQLSCLLFCTSLSLQRHKEHQQWHQHQETHSISSLMMRKSGPEIYLCYLM